MNNIMVDIETTGTDSGRHAILQISAWRFGLKEGEIDPVPFDRCLYKPPHRSWDEGTRNWWYGDKERRETLKNITARGEDPYTVMRAFCEWSRPHESPIFWSKPTHFDFPFIQSYCADYSLAMPFHYRMAQDMNTFIRALHFPNPAPALTVKFEGAAHNAVFDTLNQIQVLWAHLTQLGLEPLPEPAPFKPEPSVAELISSETTLPADLVKVN